MIALSLLLLASGAPAAALPGPAAEWPPPEESARVPVSSQPPEEPARVPVTAQPAAERRADSALDVDQTPSTPRAPPSLLDARTLGQSHYGIGVGLGFPYLMVFGAYGLGQNFDLGLGFSSTYGLVNQGALLTRTHLLGGPGGLNLALRASAEATAFLDSGTRSRPGGRWLTGQRDLGGSMGLIVSTRLSRWAVLAFDLGGQLTVDLDPPSWGPLSGPKPKYALGFNLPVRMGTEVPIDESSSFFVLVGLDFHMSSLDVPAIPALELGMTFGG